MRTNKTIKAGERTQEIIHVDIREQDGAIEAAGTVTTISEAARWFSDRGIYFGSVNMPTPTSDGFTFQRNGVI